MKTLQEQAGKGDDSSERRVGLPLTSSDGKRLVAALQKAGSAADGTDPGCSSEKEAHRGGTTALTAVTLGTGGDQLVTALKAAVAAEDAVVDSWASAAKETTRDGKHARRGHAAAAKADAAAAAEVQSLMASLLKGTAGAATAKPAASSSSPVPSVPSSSTTAPSSKPRRRQRRRRAPPTPRDTSSTASAADESKGTSAALSPAASPPALPSSAPPAIAATLPKKSPRNAAQFMTGWRRAATGDIRAQYLLLRVRQPLSQLFTACLDTALLAELVAVMEEQLLASGEEAAVAELLLDLPRIPRMSSSVLMLPSASTDQLKRLCDVVEGGTAVWAALS
eukprot:PLAT14772.2.p1 GENE.PLAT14772.2~~PLAT14772.2.p1  ORF type:complete len:337 (+),score=82.08 PLAT14772.2:467-1477(+)